MKSIIRSVIIVIALIISVHSVFSSDLLFKPLTANPLEARVGASYQLENEKLRLDIGNSFDLYAIKISDTTEVRFGADLMTYTMLRSEGRMKFPVETTDYFFGLNASFKVKILCQQFFGRVRVSHISAHIVDGMYDEKSKEFRQDPFVYSREFVDIVMAMMIDDVRVYFGGNFIFSTIPDEVSLVEPQLGADYSYKFSDEIEFKAGVDYKVFGTKAKPKQTIAFQAGFKFNGLENKGIFVGYYHYNGTSMHGMFYNQSTNYNGIGVELSFWN